MPLFLPRAVAPIALGVAVSIVAGAGCARPALNLVSLSVGAATVARVSQMAGGLSQDTGCNDGPGCNAQSGGIVLVPMMGAGVVLVAVGVMGLIRNLHDHHAPRSKPALPPPAALPPPEAPPPVASVAPAPPIDRAVTALVEQLRVHAEAGDCVRAQIVADELWEIDEEVYLRHLEGDAIIRACLRGQ
jgi:hypothetical protein